MRTIFLILLIFTTILTVGTPATSSADDNDLPGTFHPFNVTGKRANHFHCLITQHGLDPGVIVFTKDLAFSDALKDLLKQLDSAIENNPNERLAAFVVFLDDDLADVVVEDDKRDDVVAKIDALNKELMLKHVILTVHSKKYLDKFKLDDNAETTVILYGMYKIAATHTAPMLTPEHTTKIRNDIAEKLGAKRK